MLKYRVNHTVVCFLYAALAAAIAGCAREDPEGVIPEGYLNSLDKAEQVEQTLQDAAQLRMDEVDEADPQ